MVTVSQSWLIFEDLDNLMKTGKMFRRMSFNLSFPDVFLWLAWGYGFLKERPWRLSAFPNITRMSHFSEELWFFSWRMKFETKVWVLGVPTATGGIVITLLVSGWSLEIHRYMQTFVHTCIYNYFSIYPSASILNWMWVHIDVSNFSVSSYGSF